MTAPVLGDGLYLVTPLNPRRLPRLVAVYGRDAQVLDIDPLERDEDTQRGEAS